MILSNEQISFFKRHKIPLWYILNADSLTTKEYREILNSTDNLVALNSLAKICNRGHQLNIRDRHGKCVECRVSGFSFIKPEKKGYVYVVGSLEGKILKVGYSLDLKDRLYKINHDGYGGYNDWELIYSGIYDKALIVENNLHSLLKDHGINKKYSHYGKMVNCYELFKCDYSVIEEEVLKLNNTIGKENISDLFFLNDRISKYNFSGIGKKTELLINTVELLSNNYDMDYDAYLRKYGILSGKYKNNITYK